jgi:NAD(P)H dehydrogenase (quinone)
MTNLSIVYFSGSGHTTKMAEAIVKGAGVVAGTQVQVLPIKSEDIQNGRFKNDSLMVSLDSSDAVIFGSPTYMGGPSGDKLSTLHYFFTLAMQHGMVWVGQAETPMNDQGINRLSSYSGVMGQAMREPPEIAPNAADKLTGEMFGRRMAEAAARWKRGAA